MVDVEHGESTMAYRCKGCGSTLKNNVVVTVNGEPKGICDTSSCVVDGDASMSKGVVVDIVEA